MNKYIISRVRTVQIKEEAVVEGNTKEEALKNAEEKEDNYEWIETETI